ncbi:hypothetical protein [Cellulophaga baltica]|uniref:hypothetical protein n=1 Tax=Cellulophaga baltica TaxID=76594 RepID=UPI002494F37F|nr:hypothetical protein [Cellulophaga baltica]
MKIIKWLSILAFTAIMIVAIYWIGLIFIFSYGAGSGGTGLIKSYEFNLKTKNIKMEFDKTFDKNKIHLRDSVVDNSYRGFFNESLIIINLKKYNMEYIVESPIGSESLYFYLIYINGKKNDDFGWFSLEKYKAIKLFEQEIIDPLSKKYKRIE